MRSKTMRCPGCHSTKGAGAGRKARRFSQSIGAGFLGTTEKARMSVIKVVKRVVALHVDAQIGR